MSDQVRAILIIAALATTLLGALIGIVGAVIDARTPRRKSGLLAAIALGLLGFALCFLFTAMLPTWIELWGVATS